MKTITALAISFFALSIFGSSLTQAETNPNPPAVRRFVDADSPPPFIPADALQPDWWPMARQVGWPESALPTLDYVINRESKGLVNTWNRQDPQGGSRCLVQINGAWTTYLRSKGLIERPRDLLEPTGETCLRAGLAIWQYGMDRYGWGWGPWAIKKP